MATLTGLVHGRTITLDEGVPELEGKRVRVVVESAADADAVLDNESLWRQWTRQGPQGPIEDEDDESEFQ